MWNDRLRFAERVENDWKSFSNEEREALRQALEKIDEDPIAGAPMFHPLRGFWSYRVDGMRIIYRISPEARVVVVFKIGRVTEAKP